MYQTEKEKEKKVQLDSHLLGKACRLSSFKQVLDQWIGRPPIDILVGGIRIKNLVKYKLVSFNVLCHVQTYSNKREKTKNLVRWPSENEFAAE